MGLLFIQSSYAASVTSWGGHQQQTLQTQVVGRWQLIAIYENGQNITANESLKDYWIFKKNGWVEHNEEPFGLRRSSYWVKGRNLTVKPKSNNGSRVFRINYVDKEKMIWKHRQEGRTYTYNLVRY